MYAHKTLRQIGSIMKDKRTPEEIKKERDEKISRAVNDMRLQIVALNKKKDIALAKVVEARQKGLKREEEQAKGLLKQTMAASKRAEGMLMTLEIATQTRDLADLSARFFESIGALSEDIIDAGKKTDKKATKKMENAYLKAMYTAGQQKENIDQMLSVGDYASAASMGVDSYSEFDDEIESMIDEASFSTDTSIGKNKIKF